jgi:hypothetical protein
MDRPLFIVYARPWWRRPWSIALVGVLTAAVPACVVWSTTPVVVDQSSPARPVPAVAAPPMLPAFSLMAVPVVAPDAVEAPATALEQPAAALSIEVSPGTHVTPIGRPPVGAPTPTVSRVEDSEPEN